MSSAGTYRAERLRQDLRGGSLAWDAVFDVDVDDEMFAHMVVMVTATPDDIFTAKLSQTRLFFNSVRSGQVSVLCPQHLVPEYSSAIDVLTVVSTHGRLARTGIAEMRSPGYWIAARRDEVAPRIFNRDPVMPMAHLTTVTGFTDAQLKICLAPLVRDSAVKLVRNAEGVLGVLTVEGISDDSPVRRFMRR